MSKINVNTWEPESSTALTMGASGDTTTVPSGASLVVASGATINITGATQTGFPASGNTVKVAYLVDEKATTTAGGTFTSGAWRHRDLQTEYYDTIGMTFGTNTFIFPDAAGTYYIDWSCPAVAVIGHQSRLYNVTDTAVVKYGTSSRAGNNDFQTLSNGSALVTLTATATFQIEHYCSTTAATYGFGDNTDFSVVEIYTTVKIMQIA